MLKNLSKSFYTIIFGLVIAILLGELIITLTLDLPQKNYRNLYISDDYTGYKHKPNYYGTMGSVPVITNSDGFRVLDDNSSKDYYDIITVGDSFTYGHLIQYEKTFQHLLEKKIPYSVLNAGVSGYNLSQTYEALKIYLKKNNPKYVILSIHVGSDLTSQIDELIDNLKVLNGSLVSKNNLYFSSIIRSYLSSFSNLYYWLIEVKLKNIYYSLKIDEKSDKVITKNDLTKTVYNENEYLYKKDKIYGYLNEFLNLVGNKKLIVVSIPRPIDITSKHKHNANNLLTNIIDDLNITYVDMKQNILDNNYSYEDLIISEKDPHYNEFGHQILSLEIFKKLEMK